MEIASYLRQNDLRITYTHSPKTGRIIILFVFFF